MKVKNTGGFSLTEVMIAVAIVAILAAVAYPSYTDYVQRTRRPDGKNLLMQVAAAEERYYGTHNEYIQDITVLGFSADPMISESGYYSVTNTAANGQTYLLTATPIAPQDQDACGTLTLASGIVGAGTKGQTGAETNGSCW